MNTKRSHSTVVVTPGQADPQAEIITLQKAPRRRVGLINSLKWEREKLGGQNLTLTKTNKSLSKQWSKAQADYKHLIRENKRLQKQIKGLREDLRIARLPCS
ncbi:MAG: hypothetical protein ACYCOO_06800 [Chitinophagaceae bacterium]